MLIFSQEAGCEYKLFSSFGLTRAVIEPKSTVSAADALSTRLMIKMLLKKNFVTVFLYTECYAALLIRFSIARYTILRMKPIVQVFQEKIIRGGVEDTRLEAKTKDTKKIRGQGQGQPFRGQNLSRPRTGMLEAKAKDQGHRRKCSPKKKKKKKEVFKNFFQAISNLLAYPEFLFGVSPALNCRGDASPHRDLASSQRDLSAG